ncbi:MAG: peptidylprolyl isomerase [Candidatus Obscuribacterales bacterium]|nr:peptidylprolyl isomerase [Candidatus Obscuribacterales bacterium]
MLLPLFALLLAHSNLTPAYAGQDPVVLMATTKGPIAIRVFAGMVPRTANNFLDLVNRGYYNGKTFHRVENWLIQGGCPFGNGQGNFVDPDTGQVRYVPLEINRNLGHGQAGMVAMARAANPNSASCQFYILKKGMPQLNGQYAVFGMVVGGLQNVYRIGIGDQIISAQITNNENHRNSEQSQNSSQGSDEGNSQKSSQTAGGSEQGSGGSSGESGF